MIPCPLAFDWPHSNSSILHVSEFLKHLYFFELLFINKTRFIACFALLLIYLIHCFEMFFGLL